MSVAEASGTDCGHEHDLLFAAPGYRASPHRVWVVVADGFAPKEADWPWGEPIPLPRGTRVRYDQRDHDHSWRHESWDRFCVLEGPDAGRCFFLGNPNDGGPIEEDEPLGMIEPVRERPHWPASSRPVRPGIPPAQEPTPPKLQAQTPATRTTRNLAHPAAISAAGFARLLLALTDRQRLDFAYSAVSQPHRPQGVRDRGEAGSAVQDAVWAFNGWQNDETVSDNEGEWFFDPLFPQNGDVWHAGEVFVAAIALALARRDDAALSSLAEALARIVRAGSFPPSR